MKRKIIEIRVDKCNGCGLCADICHEGALGMVGGKAALLREDYCDGLGNCLPACPTGAIAFVEREAAVYSDEKVKKNMQEQPPHSVCPGSNARSIQRAAAETAAQPSAASSELRQWPVQIKLAPANAPYFDRANLLIAADCAAYARANFHGEFMRGKITLIGCPKLDGVDYSEKLTEIIRGGNIKSLTVVRMEVPCCGGIEQASANALRNSGKFIPWRVVTLGVDGGVLQSCENSCFEA
ncbi:MAG: 4Fe-4S binding protein [Clostridiales bacterium]|jgi:Fe-S-cluster-containing hydrogenase component 2|nr:4Fe-4S binding protein [Clostridiales bacterium]